MAISLDPEEIVLVNLTGSIRTTVFPFLELITFTGLIWMGIGFLDGPGAQLFPDTVMRNSCVGVWVFLVLWRFVLPLLASRRQLLLVTDQRIVVRQPRLRTQMSTIPMDAIQAVTRRRRSLALSLYGQSRPMVVAEVPKTKQVVKAIESALFD
ncbi:hypothetical protein [Corynebacterium sp. HS2168-gen11]|uniref:hypothetical protein n=1 Tax=Corynebacterium sp. HS2168-gen11 TaxID=2974027 RepID=UPI00216B1CBB|nr:hypothetical protein [Corynebacterium sp. HS2168-gen11]MCS4535863.1 hypothetical protein [Corynebacterium sp. HS2168-gen11]